MPYKLDTDTHIYFYEAEFYCLSNFSAFRLRWMGQDFDTSEHAYQWEKFHGSSPFLQGLILESRSAHEAFKMAQLHAHLVRADWPVMKLSVMREILRAKAAQHEYVRRKLLETGDRILIEDSWRDAYYGWGPEKNGHNMLGKLWMELRHRLRADPAVRAEFAALFP
jgi:ribA/ribD-fused uncharacterized protein